MKVGDLVKVLADDLDAKAAIGTILAPWTTGVHPWWEVLIAGGRIIHWPESQMELINENRRLS